MEFFVIVFCLIDCLFVSRQPFKHENCAEVIIISTEARRRALVEWRITSAFCNSSFSGIGNNWFCHRSKDSQNNLYLLLSEGIISFFLPLTIFLHLTRLTKWRKCLYQKENIFLQLLSFYHMKKLMKENSFSFIKT